MNTVFVATNGDNPTHTAVTLEAAQREALRAQKQYGTPNLMEYRWDAHHSGSSRLMFRNRERGGRFAWTGRAVVATAYVQDEKTVVDGPFPVRVRATPGGAELDVSAFLLKAVFAELIAKADDDAEGLVSEFADMADLLRQAVHGGPDSHARHAFDEKMQGFVKEFAADGTIPLYGEAVGRMAGRLSQIAAPRSVPGQRSAGAA
jgi:hypothetical protein